MAVNLEELALKSIEQYAAFSVRLTSIEATLVELNRRNEVKEDKFIAACDKLSRLEEKLTSVAEDRAVIHRRIDDVKCDVEGLAKTIKDLAETIKLHSTDHCEGCDNLSKIEGLSTKIEQSQVVDKDLKEVRDLTTSKWGLTFIRFIASRWGQIFVALVAADIALDFFAHYELIKQLWSWMHFQ